MRKLPSGFKANTAGAFSSRFILLAMLGILSTAVFGQAMPTASRLATAQVGAGYVLAHSDYARSYFNGWNIYGDLDFRNHFGGEIAYHHISDGDDYVKEWQNTLEGGVRYSRHYGRFQPYGDFLVGRGTFNYPQSAGDFPGYPPQSYFLIAFGGGSDIRIVRHINARIGFEQQEWLHFRKVPLGDDDHRLSPDFVTLDLAYHF